MEKILVSRCLIGDICRYDAKRITACLPERFKDFEICPVCPEMLGGLPCPRSRAEIEHGDGSDVLDGLTGVKDDAGFDVTTYFLKGAQATLNLALSNDIKQALLKEKSPSCGVNLIFIGGSLAGGAGVTAALLKRHGLEVFPIE